MRSGVMRNLRIAVDLDGVLADTITSFCRILNKRYFTHFTVESFDRWNAWQNAGISEDEFFRTLDEAWFDWKNIPAMEENLSEKVTHLSKFGRVDIVTGRSPETVPYANSWLEEHHIPFDTFIRTQSTNAKVKLSYDLFVDDSADLMALIASTLDSHGILYTQPWNRKAPEMPRIVRVQRWSEIPPILEEIASEE
jgi:uncharacterized HAD superfamily protein